MFEFAVTVDEEKITSNLAMHLSGPAYDDAKKDTEEEKKLLRNTQDSTLCGMSNFDNVSVLS